MIAALTLSTWRARGPRRFCAVLAALALGLHTLLMAAHRAPAADLAFHDPHALCLTSGEVPPASDGGAPHHPQAPFCPICQSLQAAVPPPQAPCVVAFPWAVARVVDPPAIAVPSPRVVLTALNPRAPPVLG